MRVEVNLVLVPVTVTDTMNHPIIGLQKQDFAIYENSKPQQIKHFSSEDGPISIGLILDFSKSMTNKVDTERAAVAAFFRNANPEDDYFVVTVSDHPHLFASTTQSIGTIQASLSQIVPHGYTALLDAIYLAAAQMRNARYSRHALLIISDGGDNNSRYRFREIKEMLQESDIEVYALGLFDSGVFNTYEEFMGKRWLGQITDATGGRTLAVDNMARVPEAAATISRELRNQYILGYTPSKVAANGKWQKIRVLVTSPFHSALQAYYRVGYSTPTR